MRKLFFKNLKLLLALTLAGCLVFPASAAPAFEVDEAISDTASCILANASLSDAAGVGSEWTILGLARGGCTVPEGCFDDYYEAVAEAAAAGGGVLHQRKYTEYSRVVLALTAIGKNPADVAGYNLLTPLGDFDKTVWQGINGPVWALIALDSGNYEMPINAGAETQATRDIYVDDILSRQLENGGFVMSGTSADADMTAMALQALSNYQDRDDVKAAVNAALGCLSQMQDGTGGFSSFGTTNFESVSQVIVALGELGISLEDSRFVKNGCTLLDNLLSYYVKGEGFLHSLGDSSVNRMATEQALYTLVSAQRNLNGNNSLYDMSDVVPAPESDGEASGSRNADVTAQEIIYPGRTFPDISGANTHENQAAIETLASRGIISGYADGTFRPDNLMTRAEFAAVVVRALGLEPMENSVFTDVPTSSWCAPYIGAAGAYGIVNGVSSTAFRPEGTVTRQEAAVMVSRAAKLCGMNTGMTDAEIQDALARFPDHDQVALWAREATAFCYSKGILPRTESEILPSATIRRCEIAQMLYNLLAEAGLL